MSLLVWSSQVTPPAGWNVVEFEEGSFVIYDATGSDAKTIASFVEEIFAKLLKTQPEIFSMDQM